MSKYTSMTNSFPHISQTIKTRPVIKMLIYQGKNNLNYVIHSPSPEFLFRTSKSSLGSEVGTLLSECQITLFQDLFTYVQCSSHLVNKFVYQHQIDCLHSLQQGMSRAQYKYHWFAYDCLVRTRISLIV